jgi:hypothetical protein
LEEGKMSCSKTEWKVMAKLSLDASTWMSFALMASNDRPSMLDCLRKAQAAGDELARIVLDNCARCPDHEKCRVEVENQDLALYGIIGCIIKAHQAGDNLTPGYRQLAVAMAGQGITLAEIQTKEA